MKHALPIEILWPRLIHIADEMATTLVRTAFSHDVIEVHDMSTGLYDDRGYLIAQSWLGATGHVGVMPVFGKSLLQTFPPERIRPGDVFICNDPWLANGQTADIFITTPAFVGGRLIGFSVNSVHHVDIGGRRGSSLSEEVYEEGLVIPHMKLYREGKPNEDLFGLFKRNFRFVDKVIGDIRAQIATGHVGSRQLEEMACDYRLESMRPLADEVTSRCENAIRESLRSFPDGTWHEEMAVEIEGIDSELKVALAVTIRGDTLEADLSGTSAQIRRPINSPINYTRAYVAVPTKLVCDPHLPNNEGTYRPLTIKAPSGSLVNPDFPAATFWRLSVGMLVGELMFRAFSKIVPDRVPADSGSVPTWQFYLNGLRKSGEPFALHQHAFGGMGGRPGKDGLASVSFPYNVRDVSAEWSEAETPLLIEKRELITDSGGPGESRGGLGEELVIQALPSSDTDPSHLLDLSGSSGRMRQGASGLLGGGPGSVASIVVGDNPLSPTASPHALVRVGERIAMRLPGGGGYGAPRKRSREAIARDLRDGYISREAAKRDYGYDG